LRHYIGCLDLAYHTIIRRIIIIFSKGKGTNQIDILNVKMYVLCGLVGQNLDIEKI